MTKRDGWCGTCGESPCLCAVKTPIWQLVASSWAANAVLADRLERAKGRAK